MSEWNGIDFIRLESIVRLRRKSHTQKWSEDFVKFTDSFDHFLFDKYTCYMFLFMLCVFILLCYDDFTAWSAGKISKRFCSYTLGILGFETGFINLNSV